MLERSDFGVLNAAESYYPQFDLPHWGYGGSSDWQATGVTEDSSGLSLEIVSPLGAFAAHVPMIGAFNALNVLAALATAARVGLNINQLQCGLETFAGVPGRMQILQHSPFRVINDFAHTGVSVAAALETLRVSTGGRLILVVGAAGQRDPARRGGIAAAAARRADLTMFTEEDHRTEPLSAILEAMRAAFIGAGGDATKLEIIPDRREAIEYAMRIARAGDTVLLAGKGHERTLERGNETLAWDETAEARAAIEQSRA